MSTKSFIFITIILFLMSIFAIIFILDIPNWQKLNTDKILNMQLSTVIYDSDNREAFIVDGTVDRVYVSLDELPEYIPQSFLAAEDTRFYDHNGIDIKRIIGAAFANLKSGSYSQGASTITQQLIKLTHLSNEKTLARKAQEAFLSIKLEKAWSKDDILEAYINTVYFGGGAYGIEAAAQRYFSKQAAELTLEEAALLAGIIKSPSSYAPHIDIEAAKKRQGYVLSAMESEGFLSSAEYTAAVASSVILNEYVLADKGSWYEDSVCTEACNILDIDNDSLMVGGYSIYTSYSPDMQAVADEIMSSSDIYPDVSAEGALVAMSPASGEIVAVIGGKEYSGRLCFNRALSAKRQPGSLLKPISTYAVAVEKYDYIPSTLVHDMQRVYDDGYTPGNSGGSFYGTVPMRTALAKSLNAATVDLADTVGIDSIISSLHRFGIDTVEDDRNLSLSLGSMTYGVSPVDMCAAYAAIANGGTYNAPHCIRKIVDRYGRVVYEHSSSPSQSISSESAYILTDMLKTAASTGTARALSSLPFPVAAKTGTSGLENGDTCDAWAAAYTPDIAVTVWFGRDDNSTGGMAASVTGGGYAAPVCAAFLDDIDGHISGTDFAMPSSLTKVLIDAYAMDEESRLLAASDTTPAQYVRYEIVRSDTELPVSDIWEIPEPVTDLCLTNRPGEYPSLRFTGSDDYSEYLIIRNQRGISEIVGTVNCKYGETCEFEDTTADISQINLYTIIPRHKLLYESGVTVTGPESNQAEYSPTGILNGISSFFTNDDTSPAIESLTKPLF